MENIIIYVQIEIIVQRTETSWNIFNNLPHLNLTCSFCIPISNLEWITCINHSVYFEFQISTAFSQQEKYFNLSWLKFYLWLITVHLTMLISQSHNLIIKTNYENLRFTNLSNCFWNLLTLHWTFYYLLNHKCGIIFF